MDGFYCNSNNNGCSCNNGGYCAPSARSGNCGSCGNCPGGQCPRMEAGGGARGRSQPGCPGGNCCAGGRCPAGKSRCNPDWQYGGR
ncbi:keratin-associated protein 5-1 [Drosophila erecta]|uniref:Uncharacterized protein n=1 Tax=Drosophila erecta TaxID=7220 RepID=B3N588_DROER|nr:keratin-associated protein 5-1 [Drosophila erecta]EDV57918.1 uncharacterized protein Dere_GG24273 [Drosophila erecta]